MAEYSKFFRCASDLCSDSSEMASRMRTLCHVSRNKTTGIVLRMAAMHDWPYRRLTTVVHEMLIDHVVVDSAAVKSLGPSL
jgi:hypothetical protein